jgi:hypothetical protein
LTHLPLLRIFNPSRSEFLLLIRLEGVVSSKLPQATPGTYD